MKTKIKMNVRSMVMVAVLLLTGICTQAQHSPQQGPPPIPNDEQIEKMVTQLSEELSLNDTQETQVSKLYLAHFEDVRNRLKKENGSGRPNREEMELQKDNFEKEVKILLTKEQQTQFDAFQRSHNPRNDRQQRP